MRIKRSGAIKMLSIYSSAFQLQANNILGWQKSFRNSCETADELVIALNTSTDDSEQLIREELRDYTNWKIIHTSFTKDQPGFDGLIKNAAMQACSGEFKLCIDADEFILPRQKPLWENLCFQLKFDNCLGYALPSLDLFLDWGHYKALNSKVYLSKGKTFRGIANQIKKQGGFIDTTRDDSCCLITEDGNYAPVKFFPNDLSAIENDESVVIVHMGYISKDSRLQRNRNFWNQHWIDCAGGTLPAHVMHDSEDSFNHYDCKPHNLRLS